MKDPIYPTKTTTSSTPPRRTAARRARLVAFGLSFLLGLTAQAQHAGVLSGKKTPAEKAAAWAAAHQPGKHHERTPKGTWDLTAQKRRSAAVKGAPAEDCEWSPQYGYGGVDGPVLAQTTFDDGSGEALYVGGDFIHAGGVPVFGIAKWDGTSWSDLDGGMDDVVFALTTFDDGSGEALYAGGFFTTAGGVPAVGIAKWDGTAWSAVGGGVDDSVFAFEVFDDDGGGDALFVGGFFSMAGAVPADNVAKWDGTTWTALGDGVDDEVDAFAIHDDGGGGGTVLYVGGFFENAGGAPADFIASWDGTSWSPVGLGMSDGVVALEVFSGELYAGGFFAFADGNPVFGIAVWDGVEWLDVDEGMDAPVLSLTTYDDGGGEALYAGGFFSLAGSVPVVAQGVARWDGTDWSALGLGIDVFFFGEVDSLGVFDDGGGADLYAGGVFFEAGGVPASFLASWDGTDWSAVLATGPDLLGTDEVVYAFEIFDDGSGPALYAGGDFLTAGGVVVNGIAKWDGTSWSPLGSGMDCEDFPFPMVRESPENVKGVFFSGCTFPSVQALAVYDDGGGPALYAGGIFDSAGGVTAANIAKWDGSTWSALDDGIDGRVESMAVYDDSGGADLYVGGEFDFASAVLVSNVARWDGAAWSALGTGVDDHVEALEVYDDGGGPDLYAGGDFEFAGGAPAAYVARWDGTSWSTLGLGMDEQVETLYVYDDGGGTDLYAGGEFDVAGGVPAPSIARWNGTSWSSVGLGMSTFDDFRSVDALAAFDDGGGTDLYAGGFFEFAGGVPAANIARWDGTAWSPLGTGTNEEIEALAVFNANGPSLYAGGFFTEAGGVASSFIGEWRCAPAELTIDDVTLAEGDAGTTDFVFTITRSHSATDVSVDVVTADGTALAGSDYTALPLQSVSFVAGGSLTTTVTVQVTADTVEEAPMKDFFVNLSSPVAATILDGQGVGTIVDDDDSGAPSVAAVDSTTGTGDGELAECEEARVGVTRLHVTFDQPVRDPAGDTDADDVTNPANYRLFAAGPDHDLTSAACAAPAGDDQAIAIDAVTYDSGSLTATLELAGELADAPHRLVVCGTILDPAGNALAGGDFTRTFRVEQENLFANGHFDCDLGGWTAASTDPGEIAYGGEDVDAASISGSAAITNLTSSTSFSIGQCVPVTGGLDYALRGAIRLAAAPGVTVFVSRSCDFFSAAGCAGAPLSSAVDVFPFGDTAGAWDPVDSEIVAPVGTASAFCGFDLAAPGGVGFSADLDDLEFLRDDAIFADGFESGNTSAWSLAVP